jgi:hypothetical protein
MDAREEVSSGLVVAGGNHPRLLELTIEVLHEVARLLQFLVVEALELSIALGRNDELFSCRKQRLGDALIGIESLVRQQDCRPAAGAEARRHLADHELAPQSGRRPEDSQGRRLWRGFWCSIRLCRARSPGLRRLFLSASAVLTCAYDGAVNHRVFVVRIWIILDRILADHFRLDRLLPRIASSLCPFLPRRVLPSKPIASALRVCSSSPYGSLRLACDVPTFPPRPEPAIEAAIWGCLAIERHGP